MNKLQAMISNVKENRKAKARWRWIAVVLSLAVFAGVSWKFAVPVETTTPDTSCGYEEHIHTEECYEQQLTCGQEEHIGHEHSEECYEVQSVLSCELEENEEHVHDETCYTEETFQICEQEAAEGHSHDESCYEMVLICGMEEHSHVRQCYADFSADVESASYWESTLPSASAMTGVWTDDLVTVALSQEGYLESSRNFIVNESGAEKGYTRYGAFFGVPYEDWCAMYASFCLYYADIPSQWFPLEASCTRWQKSLAAMDLYYSADSYMPQKGDIIFFNDAQNQLCHTGIVTGVSYETRDGVTYPAAITTIEGNSANSVMQHSYNAGDSSIAGYGSVSAAYEAYLAYEAAQDETIETSEAGESETEESEEESEESESETEETEEEEIMELFLMGDTSVTFYEGYTQDHRTSQLAMNFYYITKRTYTLTDPFDPFNTSGHTASSSVLSESIIAYCYNHDYTRPNVYNDNRTTGNYDSEYELTYTAHTHYEKLDGGEGFIDSLSGSTHYTHYDTEAKEYVSYTGGERKAEEEMKLKETLMRIIYNGYGGPAASSTISGGIADAYYRRATQRAISWFTNGTVYTNWSSNAEKAVYDKLRTGIGEGLQTPPDNLELNIYQYVDDSHYYTNGKNTLHPQATTSKTQFQNLLTIEMVEKKGHRVEFGKYSFGTMDAGNMLPGAKITVTAEGSGEIVAQWTSGNEKQVIYLNAGSYVFQEDEAPEGYMTVPKIHFTVGNDGNVTITSIEGIDVNQDYSHIAVVDGNDVEIYDSQKTSVTVHKVWEGVSPSSVRMVLLLDGEPVEGKEVTLTEAPWTYTWDDLPDYGDEHTYSVREIVPLNADYSAVYEGWVELQEEDMTVYALKQQTSSLVAGQSYVFRSSAGALGISNGNLAYISGYDTENMPGEIIWTAYSAESNSVKLYNEATGYWIANTTSGNNATLTTSQANAIDLAIYNNSNRLYSKSLNKYIRATNFGGTYSFGFWGSSSGTIQEFSFYTAEKTTVTPDASKAYQIRNVGGERTSFTVKKTWETGMTPESITIRLLRDGQPVLDSNGQEVTVTLTGEPWTYTWENIAPGNYSAEEVIPEGAAYEPVYPGSSDDGSGSEDDAEDDGSFHIHNIPSERQQISVEKIWDPRIDAADRAQSIQVQLYNSKNEAVGDPIVLSADNNWHYIWSFLDKNESYYVKELTQSEAWEAYYSSIATTGWVEVSSIPTDGTPFILVAQKAGSADRPLVIGDSEHLTVSNTSLETLLGGTAEDAANFLWQLTGNGSSWNLTNVAQGDTYAVSRANWIPSLVSDGEAQSVVAYIYKTLAEDQSTWIISNKGPDVGNIRLVKENAEDGSHLQGAAFTLYNENGEKIAEGVTDENGELSFEELPFGKYYLVETQAPDGYRLNGEKISLSLGADGITLYGSNHGYIQNPVDEEGKTANIYIMDSDRNARYTVTDTMHVVRNKNDNSADARWSLGLDGARRMPGIDGNLSGSYRKMANATYDDIADAAGPSFDYEGYKALRRIAYWLLTQGDVNYNNVEAAQKVLFYITNGDDRYEGSTDAAFVACHNAAYDSSKDALIEERLSLHLYRDMDGTGNLQSMVTASLNPKQTGSTLIVGNEKQDTYDVALPKTGGMGSFSLQIPGLILMLTAALFLLGGKIFRREDAV